MRTIESDKKSTKRLQSKKKRGIMIVICECSAYLREFYDSQAEATPEQKQRTLQKIKANHQV